MAITIEQKEEKHMPISQNNADAIVKTDKKKSSTDSSAAKSPQKLLLSLAKKFHLDGGLLPIEKQAPIEDRSFRRVKLNELRKQDNIETITMRALQYCSNNQATTNTDQDWFANFIHLAEDISNKTMQDLWAKILAKEVSHPGSFALKTLKAFRLMSIFEAKLLAKACSLSVADAQRRNIRIISGAYQIPKLVNFFNKDREQKIELGSFGLSYADILTLADNHLLFKQETESSLLAKGEDLQFFYGSSCLNFTAIKPDCILTFYKFTPIGTELAQLITDKVDEKYHTSLKTNLAENFIIKS